MNQINAPAQLSVSLVRICRTGSLHRGNRTFDAELVRLDNARLAWPSTWHAVKAVGLSMLIEMGAGVLILTTWVSSLLLL